MTTFYDRDQDTLTVAHGMMHKDQLRLVATQKRFGDATAVVIFHKDEAERIRDKLIAMYPLPTVTAEVEPAMTSIGELASFAPTQGITINIAHVTVNA